MGLSKEEKEAMAEHFRNTDLYDPSKASEQEVSDFSPKCMCGGGHVPGMCSGGMSYADGGTAGGSASGMGGAMGGMPSGGAPPRDFSLNRKHAILGMADGGDVGEGYAADSGVTPDAPESAYITPDQQRQMAAANLAKTTALKDSVSATPAVKSAMGMPDPQKNALVSVQGEKPELPPAPASMPAPSATSAAPGRLNPDQFDELIASLKPSMGQRIGQGAMSGIAGLADAIATGVGRGANPGFQRNIMEGQQNQRQDLVNALKAKYESGYKGKELAQGEERNVEEARAHKANEAETEKARQLTAAGQKLVAGKEAREAQQNASKAQVEAAQKVIEDYQKSSSLPFTAGPSKAEYASALKTVQSGGAPSAAAGPYGQTTVRNGKTYQWSPVSKQYHLAE